jgi:hypothetical protein
MPTRSAHSGQRHAKLAAASLGLGFAAALLLVLPRTAPRSFWQPGVLAWTFVALSLIVAGVLLWRSHPRRYAAGVLAWSGVAVLAVTPVRRVIERSSYVPIEQWALPTAILIFSLAAAGYLILLGWRRNEIEPPHAAISDL